MSEKQEGILYQETDFSTLVYNSKDIAEQYNEIADKRKIGNRCWVKACAIHELYLAHKQLLDNAKANAPTPQKIIKITKQRIGQIPEGGLGKAILDCIEAAEWREWFEKYFGESTP